MNCTKITKKENKSGTSKEKPCKVKKKKRKIRWDNKENKNASSARIAPTKTYSRLVIGESFFLKLFKKHEYLSRSKQENGWIISVLIEEEK